MFGSRKWIALSTLFVLLFTSVTYGATAALKIGFVTDTQGVNNFINSQSWSGIVRAGKEMGFKPEQVASKTEAAMKTNFMKQAAKQSLVIGSGFMVGDALQAAAIKYPKKSFAVIDGIFEKPNITSILFKKNEGAYLAGAMAATHSQTGVIGFVGGMDIPIIHEFLAGYTAGAKSVDPEIVIISDYINSFTDKSAMSKMAIAQNTMKADVIMHAAGGAGDGLFTAADSKGFWAIGVDYDQTKLSKKNKVLCSVVTKFSVATYEICKDFKAATLKGGTIKYLGVKEGAVALLSEGKNLTDDDKTLIKELTQEISSGQIVVPSTLEELETVQ